MQPNILFKKIFLKSSNLLISFSLYAASKLDEDEYLGQQVPTRAKPVKQ